MKTTMVRDAKYLLARVRIFGFTIVRERRNGVFELKREGRISSVDLSAVRCIAADPRDAWLLSLALEDDTRWSPREFYIAYRPGDEAPLPVQLILEETGEGSGSMALRHAVFGSEGERHMVRSLDDLLDALPFLAPPNSEGYHRARVRTLERYRKMRPKTWTEVGIDDEGTIAEFERHLVSPDDVAFAAESGITGMDRIIATFGLPAGDEWIDIATTEQ